MDSKQVILDFRIYCYSFWDVWGSTLLLLTVAQFCKRLCEYTNIKEFCIYNYLQGEFKLNICSFYHLFEDEN